MNAIVGFSQLLVDDSLSPDEKKEFTNLISINSELLMHLVNDVLDLSRLESGKTNLVIEPCDMVACCRETLHELEHRLSKGVIFSFTSEYEKYMIETDARLVKQLLGNILKNATKFTQQGVINLSLEIDEKRQVMRIAITDTGCGIPLEKQKCIFDNFEKLDEFAQGTGLGLPICREIALLLNGRIYVDSSYTEGTRFIFIHPIVVPSNESE